MEDANWMVGCEEKRAKTPSESLQSTYRGKAKISLLSYIFMVWEDVTYVNEILCNRIPDDRRTENRNMRFNERGK